MSNNIALRKYHLISLIMAVQDEEALSVIEAYFEQNSRLNTGDLLLAKLIKPLRKTITIEDILKEQHHKKPSMEAIHQLAQEINIEEPIEDLLNMLTP